MVTAMRVETSPPSGEPEVCHHMKQQTRENESSGDEEARGMSGEKELGNELLDVVQTSRI